MVLLLLLLLLSSPSPSSSLVVWFVSNRDASMVASRLEVLPKCDEDPPKETYTALCCLLCKMQSHKRVRAIWVFPVPAGPASWVIPRGRVKPGWCNRQQAGRRCCFRSRSCWSKPRAEIGATANLLGMMVLSCVVVCCVCVVLWHGVVQSSYFWSYCRCKEQRHGPTIDVSAGFRNHSMIDYVLPSSILY